MKRGVLGVIKAGGRLVRGDRRHGQEKTNKRVRQPRRRCKCLICMYAEGSRGGGEKHTVEAEEERRDGAAAVEPSGTHG